MKEAILTHNARITSDLPAKTIIITRDFDAPPEVVWRAFIRREILDEWWTPKPWKIETNFLAFKPGGIWHFCMVATKDEHFWWGVNYQAIDPQHSIITIGGPCGTIGGPCGENTNLNDNQAMRQRVIEFIASPTGTTVILTIRIEIEAALI